MLKFVFGILVSVFAVYMIISHFDFKGFENIQDRIHYEYFFPIILSNVFGVTLFSWRWYHLLDKKLKFWDCLSSSFIGLAGNMVLPARAGDMVRLFISKSGSKIPFASLVSKIFLEKVMDFSIAIFLGSGALLILGLNNSSTSSTYVLFVSSLIVFGMIFLLSLIRFFPNWLNQGGNFFFSLISKEELFHKHFSVHITELSAFLHWSTLKTPLLITLPTWIAGYSVTYYLQGLMFEVPLSFLEVYFLVFCGAIGVAIPSAPSGVGVLHASIIGGFLLLGKTESTGLVYATAVHLQQFLILTTIGLGFYLVWLFQRRSQSKEESNTQKNQ